MGFKPELFKIDQTLIPVKSWYVCARIINLSSFLDISFRNCPKKRFMRIFTRAGRQTHTPAWASCGGGSPGSSALLTELRGLSTRDRAVAAGAASGHIGTPEPSAGLPRAQPGHREAPGRSYGGHRGRPARSRLCCPRCRGEAGAAAATPPPGPAAPRGAERSRAAAGVPRPGPTGRGEAPGPGASPRPALRPRRRRGRRGWPRPRQL